MGSVNSISSLGGSAYVAAPRSNDQGSVWGAVKEMGSSVEDAVGTAYTFSAESLAKLGEAIQADFDAATDAVGEAITDTGTAIGDVVEDVTKGVSDLATESAEAIESWGDVIASTTSSVVDSVESSVSSSATSVSDAVSSATTSVVDAVSSFTGSIGTAASSAAAYVMLGIGASKALDEVA